jgi:hypothetical protein
MARTDHGQLEERMLLALHVADELLAVLLAPRAVRGEEAADERVGDELPEPHADFMA